MSPYAHDATRPPASAVLITGGYGGIGLHAAQAIHDTLPESVVIVAGRSAAAARDACSRIGPRAQPLAIDLASLHDVDHAATILDSLVASGGDARLRAIVCNAGVQSRFGQLEHSADGFELSFAVNHLAHFHLSAVFCRRCAAQDPAWWWSAAARTIPARSKADSTHPRYHRAIELARPELDPRPPLSSIRRYATSKLCTCCSPTNSPVAKPRSHRVWTSTCWRSIPVRCRPPDCCGTCPHRPRR